MFIYDFDTELATGYRWYTTTAYDNDEISHELHNPIIRGTNPLSPTWEPLHVIWMDDSDPEYYSGGPSINHADISHLWNFFGCPLLSQRAVSILRPILNDKVEFLPLVCDEPNVFVMMKVLNVFDYSEVLDEAKSKIFWSPQTKRMIEAGFPKEFDSCLSRGSHVLIFKESVVENQLIFKIQQCDTKYTFVTQQFVDIITQNNLTGGKFTRVYPPMTEELRQQAYEKAMKKRRN